MGEGVDFSYSYISNYKMAHKLKQHGRESLVEKQTNQTCCHDEILCWEGKKMCWILVSFPKFTYHDAAWRADGLSSLYLRWDEVVGC